MILKTTSKNIVQILNNFVVRSFHQKNSTILTPLKINPIFFESKRFMRPVKPVQYKYDYRYLEDKEYTHEPIKLPKLGGRDPETGKKINQRIGGGVKFDFYWITTYPFVPKENSFYEERVLEVRRDTNHSAFIALVAGRHGRRWILAREGLKAGDVVRITNHIPEIPFVPKYGEIYPIGAIADGTEVCCVETIPGTKSIQQLRAIHAGTFVTVSGRKGNMVMVTLKNKKEILIDGRCMATVGVMSNSGHAEQHWGSMNMKRRMGIKQGSGEYHKKDGYCGRKVHRLPPPLLIVDSKPPVERYKITMSTKDYCAGFGQNEYNPVLKGW